MMQSALARQPLLIVGGVGLVAGVLVAYHFGASPDPTEAAVASVALPAHVAQVAQVATAGAPANAATPAAGGIVFLDSRPAEPGLGVNDSTNPPGPPVGPDAVSPAAASPRPSPGAGGFVRMVVMMTCLVGGVLAWYLTRRRKLGGRAGGTSKALSLVGSVRIAGRWQVALVKVPGKTLVLGATDKGLTLLSELDDDVADDVERDELASRVRADDTMAFGAHATPAATSKPGAVGPPPPPPADGFGRLLEQLTRGAVVPPPQRERPKTDEAIALRARLERHQAGTSAEPLGLGPKHTPPN